MKIATILGTRPEIIRLCRIIPKLDAECEHVLIHTGQNYDVNLKDIFFQELGVRAPDHYLGASGSMGQQIGEILAKTETVLASARPDRILILGDTNSGLAALIAKRMGIRVYHMEAGNRCHDDRVPEEVNRRVIDHSSDVLLPYTERSRENLLAEGIPGRRIFVTGNPIYEVLRHHQKEIDRSDILSRLTLRDKGYFLVTLHRAENVDIEARLRSMLTALADLAAAHDAPVIISTHPRTRNKLETFGFKGLDDRLRFLEPFGFFDFLRLEGAARCVLSDSGTVQEECAILKTPNVTLRDVTERPETVECGSNILSGADRRTIVSCVERVLGRETFWAAPPEYLVPNVSDTVLNILLSYRHEP